MRRMIFLAVALALAGTCRAGSSLGSTRASAQLDFRITIPDRVMIQHKQSELPKAEGRGIQQKITREGDHVVVTFTKP